MLLGLQAQYLILLLFGDKPGVHIVIDIRHLKADHRIIYFIGRQEIGIGLRVIMIQRIDGSTVAQLRGSVARIIFIDFLRQKMHIIPAAVWLLLCNKKIDVLAEERPFCRTGPHLPDLSTGPDKCTAAV
ncbi:hypothetical protein D9M68_766000 [compost metagenome]